MDLLAEPDDDGVWPPAFHSADSSVVIDIAMWRRQDMGLHLLPEVDQERKAALHDTWRQRCDHYAAGNVSIPLLRPFEEELRSG